MNQNLKIGIIGAGGIARSVHMPSLSEIEGVEVVAICDLHEDKAKELAAQYGVKKTYAVYHDMLKEQEMDAVYVLVNPDCTFRVADDCMKAGFHVMVEKPLGIDSYQAHSLARTSKDTGKTCAVAMNRRHIPLIQEVLRRVKAVTKITEIDGRFMKFSDIADCWNYASAYNCDIIHAIDLVRYIAGAEPKSAGTVIGSFDSPVDNAWISVMEFDNGIIGTLRANYQSAARVHDFEIHGPNACAFINIGFADAKCEAKIIYNNGSQIYSAASAGVGDFRIEELDGLEIAGGSGYHQYYGYKSEDQDFVNFLRTGEQPLCVAEDAAKSMDMVEFLLRNKVN